jgi:hypothetical protein
MYYQAFTNTLDRYAITLKSIRMTGLPGRCLLDARSNYSLFRSVMKLTLRPTEVPFAVGDTVWVDQPYGAVDEFASFQGTIMQIILDGSLANTLVVRHSKETHELGVSSAVYGLKPVGDHAGEPRVNVNVQLLPLEEKMFATQAELLAHQDRVA